MATPLTVTVAEASKTPVPTVFELTMRVHWPLESVTVVVHVPPVIEPTPLVLLPVTVTPEAALQPLPSFCSTVTVKVCGSPTLLVPDGVMLIRASTYVFVAGPEPPGPD